MGIISIFDPLLLYKLELPEEAGVQRHENDPMLIIVADWLTFRSVRTIRQSTSGNTPAVNQSAVEPECIAGIGSSYMGSNWAACSIQIFAESEIYIRILVFDNPGIRFVRRNLDRSAITPSADEF